MRPDYLSQGELARLFPVLSNKSLEGRTTSIVLACLSAVDKLGAVMLATVGERVGKRANLTAYTEVVFKNQKIQVKDRPDGLLILKVGPREWRALVEAKIGNNDLDPLQIEKYRDLAKDHKIDCVITISNQFTSRPNIHPIEAVRKRRSRIPVFHWSWMNILTQADLLWNTDAVDDGGQVVLLNELRRFLAHESAGVKGFSRMPKAWPALNKHVSVDGAIPARSSDAEAVIDAWHQETRDLSFILSRMTETRVSERLPKKFASDPVERKRHDLDVLRTQRQLLCELDVPDAAAPIEILADMTRRTIEVGMSLKAPGDKKSTKARLNWVLRQIKTENLDDLHIRSLWLGKTEPNSEPILALKENPDLASRGKEHLVARRFHVFSSTRLGAKFTQPVNFIAELERLVPLFYGEVGSKLFAWKQPAPALYADRIKPEDGTSSAIGEEADLG